jgi:hypothetical protein
MARAICFLDYNANPSHADLNDKIESIQGLTASLNLHPIYSRLILHQIYSRLMPKESGFPRLILGQ